MVGDGGISYGGSALRFGVFRHGVGRKADMRRGAAVACWGRSTIPRQGCPTTGALAEAQADLRTLDRLRPLLTRLQRLSERAADTEMALGSDLMNVALEGYGLLKITGRNKGLESASAMLSARFARASRRAEAAPAA